MLGFSLFLACHYLMHDLAQKILLFKGTVLQDLTYVIPLK